jgi:hypothetical protein
MAGAAQEEDPVIRPPLFLQPGETLAQRLHRCVRVHQPGRQRLPQPREIANEVDREARRAVAENERSPQCSARLADTAISYACAPKL